MERREFIRNGVLTIAGLGVSTFLGRQGSGLLDAAESSPEIFVAKGGSPEELTNRAVIGAGGMGRFVKAGNKVVIKPNIAWNRTPEQGANTHPGVVTALI
jgi:hypothetical protein